MVIMGNCRNDYNHEISKKIASVLGDDLKNYKYIVIIPGSGCTGCITFAENFFVDNVDNKEMIFIFTDIISRKQLSIKLKAENIQRPNVLIDSNKDFYLTGYKEKIYPVIATIDREKIVKIQMVNDFSF
jgi:hypothetical protein